MAARPPLHAVSLFSNCGAGDVGYRRAGFHFDAMAELDARRLDVALLNHPGAQGISGDLRETWPQVIESWRKKHGKKRPALLAACPPCQGMSSARSGRGKNDDAEAGGRDTRNLLVTVIADAAAELAPRAIVVENVPAFLTRVVPHPETGGPISAALLLLQTLRDDYLGFAMLADLAHWGVPQTRKRAFLTLIRRDEAGLAWLQQSRRTPYPRPTHAPDYGGSPISLRAALAELGAPDLDAATEASASDLDDPLHQVPVWRDRRYGMVASIPANSGRSAWDNNRCVKCREVSAGADDAVCRRCAEPLPRPVVQDQDGQWRMVKGFRTSSYTRMRPDMPASTITTASGHVGSDRTVHPWQNRLLSVRECAYLQTLPADFAWGEALRLWGTTNVREMIGEAVPPAFTLLHGRAVRGVLDEKPLLPHLIVDDHRIERAERNLRAAKRAAGLNIDEQLALG
jgi:DNA (cytosine-5)-methyltransferase 1